ncbi:phosphoheptose isomerase [Thermosulfuriphilus sp.]
MFVRPSKLTDSEKSLLLHRLWEKDPSLWSSDEEVQRAIANRLGWLDLPQTMPAKIEEIQMVSQGIKDEFEAVCLLGMGGSSLFALTLSKIFGPEAGYPYFFVLDTTDPEEVAKIEEDFDLTRVLFVVASKSGTTIEVVSLFKYFWAKLEELKERPGENFVAITDPGTPLAQTAQEKGFRHLFLAPPDVGGRFSALSFFGLVPAGLLGLDIERLLSKAQEMATVCGPEVAWEYNPAANLAEYLGENFILERDKLTILSDPLIRPFSLWIEQLVAESTGKTGIGIVPIVGEAPGSPTVYGPDRFFVNMGLEGRRDVYGRLLSELKQNSFPLVNHWWEDRYEIGAECFRWEMATALAGYFLDINPFDEPDVIRAKRKTAEILKLFQKTGDFGVEFGLDERTGHAFITSRILGDTPSLKLAIRKFFLNLSPWSYVAFLAYLPYAAELEEFFTDLRTMVRTRRQCSTMFGFGPRYLHSSGQLHKGGPRTGSFFIFTRRGRKEEQKVPGEAYTLWDLQFAQAYGDFQALSDLERQVIHIHLGEDYRKELEAFAEFLKETIELAEF